MLSLDGPRLPDDLKIRLYDLIREAESGNWNSLSSVEGGGPVAELESLAVELLGGGWCLAMNSATSALITALIASGIRPGDEVVVPSYSWPQTLFPVLSLGAVPVFADVAERSATIDPAHVLKLVSSRTRAVVAAHLYGYSADLTSLKDICRCAGIPLILDAAQGVGITYWTARKLADRADFTAISFGRGKVASAGEGGALLGLVPDYRDRAMLISQHPLRASREVDDLDAIRKATGLAFNFRLHPWLALLAGMQLERLYADLPRPEAAVQHPAGFIPDERLDGSIPEGSLIVGTMDPRRRQELLTDETADFQAGNIHRLLSDLAATGDFGPFADRFKRPARVEDCPRARERIEREVIRRAIARS